MPLKGSNPTLGIIGAIEDVEEVKIEILVRKTDLSSVLDAMVDSHPYEEIAYDIYKLSNEDREIGMGRIGTFKEKYDFKDFINICKIVFGENIKVA